MYFFIYRLILLFGLLIPASVFAAISGGAGDFANSLLGPVSILANIISSISIIVGICFIFSAFLRYMQHRDNPMVSPLSTVIVLLILGIVLICLPLAYKITEGVPITS